MTATRMIGRPVTGTGQFQRTRSSSGRAIPLRFDVFRQLAKIDPHLVQQL